MKTILVTGGTGYIGSHTCVELLEAGFDIVIVDNFANSSPLAAARIESITGRTLTLVKGDICDETQMQHILKAHKCEAVIHFAGLKAVGESSADPLKYYHNNVSGTTCLLRAMNAAGVKTIVFSSSATVYGAPRYLPYDEGHPLSPTNPYGQTKLVIENMLKDLCAADPQWSVSILRYFNPCGAHKSGQIGEDPKGVPNNLMPFVAQVAAGKRAHLNIFGDDYDTPDGTGIRDYIHVCDLAHGHLKALEYITTHQGLSVVNLGTGNGYSVLEMLAAFSEACGRALPHKVVTRRAGDLPSYYANPDHARALYGWEATRGIAEMCADHWHWQSRNPDGYT